MCERETHSYCYDEYYKFILSIYRVRASDSVFVCVSGFVYYGAYCTHQVYSIWSYLTLFPNTHSHSHLSFARSLYVLPSLSRTHIHTSRHTHQTSGCQEMIPTLERGGAKRRETERQGDRETERQKKRIREKERQHVTHIPSSPPGPHFRFNITTVIKRLEHEVTVYTRAD